MKLNDTLCALVIGLLAGFVLIHIQAFPPMPGQKYGPAVYPGLIASGLLVCAALLFVRGLKTVRAEGLVTFGTWWRDPGLLFGFWLIVAVIAVYVWVSERAGFIPTSVAALVALMLTFRVKPALAVAVAVGGTLLIHTIFYKGLRVPLPWGWLTPFAW